MQINRSGMHTNIYTAIIARFIRGENLGTYTGMLLLCEALPETSHTSSGKQVNTLIFTEIKTLHGPFQNSNSLNNVHSPG